MENGIRRGKKQKIQLKRLATISVTFQVKMPMNEGSSRGKGKIQRKNENEKWNVDKILKQ